MKSAVRGMGHSAKRTLRQALDAWGARSRTDRIFFLHIPKTGGQSVREALSRGLSPDRHFHLDAVRSKTCAEQLGAPLRSYRESILLYAMSAPGVIYLDGHFAWSDVAMSAYAGRWNLVTVLRNPVDRWISQYFFNRFKGGEHFRVGDELEAYLESDEGRWSGSLQAALLCDPGVDYSERVRQAKANLDRFEIVGTTENLDAFARAFSRFGLHIEVPHLNRSPRASGQDEVRRNPALMKRIEALCEQDLDLYEYARTRIW